MSLLDIEALSEQFAALKSLSSVKKQHQSTVTDQLVSVSWPTRRTEDWKYIDLSLVKKTPWRIPPHQHLTLADLNSWCSGLSSTAVPPRLDRGIQGTLGYEDLLDPVVKSRGHEQLVPLFLPDAYHIVFVNGYYMANLSNLNQQAGVSIEEIVPHVELGHYHNTTHPFVYLNQRFCATPLSISITEKLDKPVQWLNLTTGTDYLCSPYIRWVIDQNAAVTLFEQTASLEEGQNLLNTVCEVHVKEQAQLHHIKLQQTSAEALQFAGTHVTQQARSEYQSYSLAIGGRLAREDLHVRLMGERATCQLYGAYLLRHKQQADHHTAIYHEVPHCESEQLYKGIVEDKAHAIFNGKVQVMPGARGTRAKQRNDNLLLSSKAEVDTKPELQIYNDDVSCTHGATVGQLDEDQFFYFASRGVPKELAQFYLKWGFIRSIIADITGKRIKNLVEQALLSQLDPQRLMHEV